MIISRTPFRSSFFGGGSDIPAYYLSKDAGAVLSAAINKYMYISVHPFFNRKEIQLKYSKTERVKNPEKIEHPIIRECLRLTGIKGGIEITSSADIPAGTGLGSSSSFTVGLLHALSAFGGRFVSKHWLASQACEVEINRLGEPIGKQDQFAASYGGFNIMEFHKDGQVCVNPVNIKGKALSELEKNLIMFFTKTTRTTRQILVGQSKRIASGKAVESQRKLVDMVWQARDMLYGGDLAGFGSLLDSGWKLKKSLSQNITNDAIDKYYGAAISAGAKGGKLLGAGGGGFLLFYCEPKYRENVRKALPDLYELKFRFDWQGSNIIYVGDKHLEGMNGFFE